jgi:hypothetical protein
MVSLSTYGGWAGIALIGAGYWYLDSTRRKTRAGRGSNQKQTIKPTETRKEGRSKKQQAVQDGDEKRSSSKDKKAKAKANKPKGAEVPADTAKSVTDVPSNDTKDADDEVDNNEFARQLQNARSGKIATSNSQSGAKQKSVKQSKAKEQSTSNTVGNSASGASVTSSSAGDDLEEAEFPTLPARSGDVSDMLEAPAPSAAVLRITEPATPSLPKKEKKPTQPAEVPLTKKQRQRQKKAEEAKAASAEAERERRVLLEKQLRTAREAEGRAAKDGQNWVASSKPTSSAWTETANVNTAASNNAAKPELLDTFGSKSNVVEAPKPMAAPEVKEEQPLPSEEEQIRLLEEDSAWNTVTSKKSKKKASDSEPSTATKPAESARIESKAAEPSASTTQKPAPKKEKVIIGDPTIDISKYTHNGKPANAVLTNGNGEPYGFTLADDEWEVA